MKKSNQSSRFIICIICAVGSFIATLGNLCGQETTSSFKGDTLFKNEKYTLRYYVGCMSINNFEIKNTDYLSLFNLRTGFLSKYNVTENFGLNFDVMSNLSTDQNSTFAFTSFSIYYNPGKFKFSIGKTASPITKFRPYPISFGSQVEYISTSVLGANKYSANASYCLGKSFSLNAGAGEFGDFLGDSTQYSLTFDYKGFSLGAYSLEKNVGLIAKYCSPYFEIFTYYKQELFSSYVQFVLSKKHSLYFATDFVYDYSLSKEFGKETDYLEVMLMQFFDLGNIIQNKVEGMYGIGITYEKYITLYFGFHF